MATGTAGESTLAGGSPTAHAPRERLRGWLLEDTAGGADHPGPGRDHREEHVHPWWKVMCLTGVDYFSTLGYQPGIAFLAAGVLSPLATLVLVLLTLVGALPVYRRVAGESTHGEGSIAMLEKVLPWWGGKVFVLVLLGFAATDFLITMTLSAADASAHALENPFLSPLLHGHQVLVTLVLLALLGGVFLRGFSEAMGVAVVLVAVYLTLNTVVAVDSVVEVARSPHLVVDWTHLLRVKYSDPFAAVGFALLAFPKLALGMSGFETGVAVMPQVRGAAGDDPDHPAGRIRGTRRLLTVAASIMSVFLVVTSVLTTVLIPARQFQPGGHANGRALAYLAHEHLGSAFGTVYDASTIAILWFAGASAMAGLLNLVPRYLPRYGMAPRWTRATRPLVLVLVAVAFLVTLLFHADVDRQASAYATGVLVLMTSAAVAVTLSAHRRGQRAARGGFAVIAVVFAYTTVDNVVERPDGVKIAGCFIAAILVVSFLSRTRRAFELRATSVSFDATAQRFLDDATEEGVLHVIANEADARDDAEYREKHEEARRAGQVPPHDPVVFLEVTIVDASDFESALHVRGEDRAGHRVLTVDGPVVANTIAAVLMEMRDRTGLVPGAYFTWTEGDPVVNMLRFLFVGDGEVAPVTREVLREAEPDPARRPRVHVG